MPKVLFSFERSTNGIVMYVNGCYRILSDIFYWLNDLGSLLTGFMWMNFKLLLAVEWLLKKLWDVGIGIDGQFSLLIFGYFKNAKNGKELKSIQVKL